MGLDILGSTLKSNSDYATCTCTCTCMLTQQRHGSLTVTNIIKINIQYRVNLHVGNRLIFYSGVHNQ